MFVADGPYFDRMFKMVLIFAIRVLFGPSVTPFKSLTEHCISDTICIRVCYVYVHMAN